MHLSFFFSWANLRLDYSLHNEAWDYISEDSEDIIFN